MRRGIACVLLLGCSFDSPAAAGDDAGSGSSTAPTTTTASSTSSTTAQPTTTMGTTANATGGSGSTGGPIDLGPFGEPQAIAELNTGDNEDDPTLPADMLEIYFDTSRGGSSDIYRATRGGLNQVWEAPTPVGAVNTGSSDHMPEISSDGLTMLFTSDRTGNDDIYVSTRRDRDSGWEQPMRVDDLSSAEGDFTATPTGDGSVVYLCSNRNTPGGPADIFRATTTAGGWTTPVVVPGLSTPDSECSPWVDAQETYAAVHANRRGGMGQQDLWMHWRSTVDQPFGDGMPMTELNSPGFDLDPWLSPDMRTIFFASNRTGGNPDLYVAVR